MRPPSRRGWSLPLHLVWDLNTCPRGNSTPLPVVYEYWVGVERVSQYTGGTDESPRGSQKLRHCPNTNPYRSFRYSPWLSLTTLRLSIHDLSPGVDQQDIGL